MKKPTAEYTEARARLLKILKPGTEVYSVVHSVSSSGMSRNISFFVTLRTTKKEERKYHPTGAYAQDITFDMLHLGIGSRPRGKYAQGLTMGGCGMDMCFSAVYNLGRTLWPKGTRKPHGTRNGEADRAGGYALNSRRFG